MIDRTLLTANDFVGVRASLVRELGNDPASALVLTRIFFRADPRWREAVEVDGEWWWRAGHDVIGEETGLTKSQVRRAIGLLVDAGHIETVKHHLQGVSDQTLSYRVVLVSQTAPDVSNPAHHHVPSPALLPTNQTEKKVDTTREPSDFDRFYATWPRKVGRPAALRAFTAAVRRGTPPALITAGAAAYARWATETKQDPQFVPYPATWLNRDGWNDQLVWPEQRPTTERPRRLTAVEQNLAEFEAAYGDPPPPPMPELPAVRPFPHHAVVDYRVVDPQDTTNQVFIRCPECESEWGWRDDINGAINDLMELAALHNSGAGR